MSILFRCRVSSWMTKVTWKDLERKDDTFIEINLKFTRLVLSNAFKNWSILRNEHVFHSHWSNISQTQINYSNFIYCQYLLSQSRQAKKVLWRKKGKRSGSLYFPRGNKYRNINIWWSRFLSQSHAFIQFMKDTPDWNKQSQDFRVNIF